MNSMLLLLLLGVWPHGASTAWPQTRSATQQEPAITTRPTASRVSGSARFEKEIAAYERRDRTDPPPKNAILFIGSSTVRRWKTLDEDFPEHRVINRGFGGSQIVDATYFAERIIFPYEPRAIFLRSGPNDIHAGKTAEQVFTDFKEFVDKVHAKLPQTTIVFIGVCPVPARWSERDANKALNTMVEKYAEKTPHVRYIEAYNDMLDDQGRARPELLASDRLHFSPEGYKILADRVRPFLPPPDKAKSGSGDNLVKGPATQPGGAVMRPIDRYTLDYNSPVDPQLQARLETIDALLREKLDMTGDDTAVGVLDLAKPRVAMIHPDRIEYAASVPKIGILLAYFELHTEAATDLDPTTQHELALMIKVSSNEMAAKYSQQMGLKTIQGILNKQGFYDPARGGGIWVGKHYDIATERYPDPVGGHSHAATVRQLLRYFLLLEQGRLVSPQASRKMRDIFATPDIPHHDNKFVKGLAGRSVEIIRKSGTWENWLHDTAVITGPGRHYILVALTEHPRGDEYLVELAGSVDDLMQAKQGRK